MGWPLDDSLPTRCRPNPPQSGTVWDGWANLQFPASLSVAATGVSDPIYGRVYRAGETSAPGQAPGWEAELGFGPLGTLPTGEGRCWDYAAASFNVDVGNDDEYQVTLSGTLGEPGLYGLYYRYRPTGGAWRYGDLDGSDDGISVEQAARLTVTGGAEGPLIVATLNLRCRLDDWAARKPLVVQALARVDPDLVAFQEDCIDAGGPAQVDEIAAELSTYTRRGYETRRVGTHQAMTGMLSFDEGISLLSALPVGASHSIDLPYAQIPRKALAADVVVGGEALRLYSTHFDFGVEHDAVRKEAAEALIADFPASGWVVVGGDLNAAPNEPAIDVLGDALTDWWSSANPSSAGLTFPADAPTRRIDYLFGPALALVGAKLLDESEGGTWLSDHRGVAVAVALD